MYYEEIMMSFIWPIWIVTFSISGANNLHLPLPFVQKLTITTCQFQMFAPENVQMVSNCGSLSLHSAE